LLPKNNQKEYEKMSVALAKNIKIFKSESKKENTVFFLLP